MESIIELRKKTGVLVAAHRGTSGGNIPPNSIAAFDIALKEGADILEMDLFQSIDGELFVFHTGMEPSHLDRHIRIERYTAGEIRQMRLCNGDLQQTFLPVNSLEHLKGKCKLNLDRSINIIEPVMKAVKKHGMEDQILMKSDPSDQSLKLIEAYAPTIDYMPIFMEEDLASDKIEKMNINYIGAEIVFEKETSPEKKAPLIKQICKVEGQLYGLRYGVVFDAQNRVLNCNGKKMSLSPQQCQILKLFLDAPDYTVTDEDIIKFIWKGQSNVQINTFCSAGNKLGKRLEQAGCGVCFRRFGSDRYRMLFIDDLVDNDLT